MFVDEFLARVIGVIQLTRMTLNTPKQGKPSALIQFTDPYSLEELEFSGKGPTIGHCLRDILDQLNERIPLGGDDYTLQGGDND